MKTTHQIVALAASFLAISAAGAEDLYRWGVFFSGQPYETPNGSCEESPALTGVAVDVAGNVYAAEGKKHTIVRITPEGKMTILAGSPGKAGTEDGLGAAARFNNPQDVATDSNGNLYVSDQKNHLIRKINAAGIVTTLAGSPGIKGSADGTGRAARFYHPGSIGIDRLGNLFVADACNNAIRRITPAGVSGTLAGRAAPGQRRLNNSDAPVGIPGGLAVDGGGNIFYVQHKGHVIRKVTPDGTITTVGGTEEQTSEAVDGPRDIARFQKPAGLAIDAKGNLYVTDLATVRKISSVGTVSTIGGRSEAPTHEGGIGILPRPTAGGPCGVAVSSMGFVYVSTGTTIVRGTPTQ